MIDLEEVGFCPTCGNLHERVHHKCCEFFGDERDEHSQMFDKLERLHRRQVLRGWRRVLVLHQLQTRWASVGFCSTCQVTWPCATATVMGLPSE